MPDEEGNELADKEEVPSTSLHAHGDGREDDVEGAIVDEDANEDDVTKTGGPTSGAASDDPDGQGDGPPESGDVGDDTPIEEGIADEGLGTGSGAIGGGERGDADLSDARPAPRGPLDTQR